MSLGAIVFLVFLLGKIFDWGPIGDWSWFVVFLPLIIEAIIDIVILLFFFLFAGRAANKFVDRWWR